MFLFLVKLKDFNSKKCMLGLIMPIQESGKAIMNLQTLKDLKTSKVTILLAKLKEETNIPSQRK